MNIYTYYAHKNINFLLFVKANKKGFTDVRILWKFITKYNRKIE